MCGLGRRCEVDSNICVPESTKSGSVVRTAPSHMSACGWGSGGSVGRTFPTQKIAALRAAEGEVQAWVGAGVGGSKCNV